MPGELPTYRTELENRGNVRIGDRDEAAYSPSGTLAKAMATRLSARSEPLENRWFGVKCLVEYQTNSADHGGKVLSVQTGCAS